MTGSVIRSFEDQFSDPAMGRQVAGAELQFRAPCQRPSSGRRTGTRACDAFVPSEYRGWFWWVQTVGRTSGNASAGGLAVPWAVSKSSGT